MIFSFVHDFAAALDALPAAHPRRRILKLLDEAVRRDVQFLDRHPTALFQCLWNSGWWFDCPDRERHYEPTGPSAARPEPAGPRLHRLLGRWRAERDQGAGTPWLRAHRPPAVPLGGPQRAVLRGHRMVVGATSFSPDGTVIASGSADATARLWEASSGRELFRLDGHTGGVTDVAFSPDGGRLATASLDGTVRVWRVGTGQLDDEVRADAGGLKCVRWLPDGRELVAAGLDGTLVRWHVPERRATRRARWPSPVHCLAVAPDGSRLAMGCADNRLRIVVAGTWTTDEFGPFASLPSGVVFTADGRDVLLAEGGRVWSTNRLARPLFEVRTLLMSLDCGGDSARLVAAGYDNNLYLWDLRGGEPRLLRGHEKPVFAARFSPDGWSVVSSGDDRSVRVWLVEDFQPTGPLPNHDREEVLALATSADGRYVATGDLGGQVRLWAAADGAVCAAWNEHRGRGHVHRLGFSPDGRRLVSAGDLTGALHVWDVPGRRYLGSLRAPGPAALCVAFSADGRWLASGGNDGAVRKWDLETFREYFRLRGHDAPVEPGPRPGRACAGRRGHPRTPGCQEVQDLRARGGYTERRSPRLQQGPVGPPGSTCRDRRDSATHRRNTGGYLPLGSSRLGVSAVSEVTRILSAIEQGDPSAAGELLPLVYDELRKLAGQRLAREEPGQTLDATALVHEAYVRLVDTDQAQRWNSRGHFFAAAAEAMRRILVENARRKRTHKHGGDQVRRDLDAVDLPAPEIPEDVEALDEALNKLAATDPKAAELVQLRFFAGLPLPEVAQLLGVSPRTADRVWAYARAWLHQEIQGPPPPGDIS
jgi:RNA polymerase sigma factor (TIGR02999 family)